MIYWGTNLKTIRWKEEFLFSPEDKYEFKTSMKSKTNWYNETTSKP